MLIVIARIIAKSSKINETRTLLESLIEPTKNEEGCIRYDLHQGISEKNVFFFYEAWESRPALEKHLANDHLVHFRKEAEDLLQSSMEVFLLNEVHK